MQFLTQWFKRHLSDSGVVFLALFLVIGFAVVITMGDMLMPVLASAVIAYLLDGVVDRLKGRGVPHIVAVSIVFCLFLLFCLHCDFWPCPYALSSGHPIASAIADNDLKRSAGFDATARPLSRGDYGCPVGGVYRRHPPTDC